MWASQVLRIVPELILVPYLIGKIGEEGYGAYALIWTLMLSIDRLELSLQSGVVKYSASFLAHDNIKGINSIISSSFIYSMIVGIVTSIIVFGVAIIYKDSSHHIGSSLFVVGIMVILIIPLSPYVAIIQSKQYYFVGAILETISKYSSLLLIMVLFALTSPSIDILIIVMAVTLFLSRLSQVPIAYHLVPGLKNSPYLFNRNSFHLIAAFGGATVLASLCLAMNSTGIRWLMDTIASRSFIAHLAIMLMPTLIMAQIVESMVITAMPASSTYEATGNQKKLQDLLLFGIRYTTILVVTGSIAVGLLMKNVLTVWVGTEYIFLAPYASVLFFARAFMLSTGISHQMLKGLGKLKAVVLIYTFGLVIIPFGVIILLYAFGYDPYLSVTIGLGAGYVFCGCFQIAMCSAYVQANLREIIIRIYIVQLFIAIMVFSIAFCFLAKVKTYDLIGRGVVTVFTIVLFWSCCYILALTSREREQMKELIMFYIKKSIQKHATTN